MALRRTGYSNSWGARVVGGALFEKGGVVAEDTQRWGTPVCEDMLMWAYEDPALEPRCPWWEDIG